MSNENKLEEIRTKISHITIQFHNVEQAEQLLVQGKITTIEYNGVIAAFLGLNRDLQNLIMEYVRQISEPQERKARQDKRIEDLGFTP